MDGWTNQRTNGPTDQQTNGWTKPLIVACSQLKQSKTDYTKPAVSLSGPLKSLGPAVSLSATGIQIVEKRQDKNSSLSLEWPSIIHSFKF